jgi:two-component system, OmpR family, sensor histidine kinase BaeS
MEDSLALLVHELRSPVAALVAIAETLMSPAGLLPRDDARRLLELAVAAGRDVERIVVDATPSSLRPERVDPAALVVDVAATASLSGGVVRAEAEPGLPWLEADPVRLRQALGNLVANALAHSHGEVVVAARRHADGVALAVSDSGEGIEPERQTAVFEAGTRFADRPGEGLGLAVVRAVVVAHGGFVELESAPGRGSVFRLVLPPGGAGR